MNQEQEPRESIKDNQKSFITLEVLSIVGVVEAVVLIIIAVAL